VVDGVPLTSKQDLADMLNEFRAQVTTPSVDFHDVLDFYSAITAELIHWLLVGHSHVAQLCSMKDVSPRGVVLKRSGGRLKQDLDKDFKTIYAYIHAILKLSYTAFQ